MSPSLGEMVGRGEDVERVRHTVPSLGRRRNAVWNLKNLNTHFTNQVMIGEINFMIPN